jgi:predicted RNA-binding protein YlqC (UPF0109 family)
VNDEQSFKIMAQERDREFVEMIIKELVNHPDDVVVTRTVDELGVLLSVKVHKEDMGLLIGRSGSTAKAIRALVRIVGMRNNARVNLRIEEPEGGRATGGEAGKARDVEDVMNDLGNL